MVQRSRVDIAEEILKIAVNGASKTQIIYAAKVNFNIVNRYLELLEDRQLIRLEKGIFVTTTNGNIFREMAEQLRFEFL